MRVGAERMASEAKRLMRLLRDVGVSVEAMQPDGSGVSVQAMYDPADGIAIDLTGLRDDMLPRLDTTNA